MQIAAVACQREVIRVLGAAVLLRHDVLYMMDQFGMFLAQPAIFATLASPPPDEVPRRRIHLLLNLRVQIPLGFELEDRDEIRCVDQRLIFRAFAIAKRALVGAPSERIDSFLNWRGNLQIDYSACGLAVETAAQRLQKAIQPNCSAHVLTLTRSTVPPGVVCVGRPQRTMACPTDGLTGVPQKRGTTVPDFAPWHLIAPGEGRRITQ